MVSFDKFGGSCGTPSKRFLSRDKVLSFFKPTKQLLLHPTRWLSLKINFFRDSRQLIAAGNVVSMLLDKSSECSFVMVSTFGGMVLSFCHFNRVEHALVTRTSEAGQLEPSSFGAYLSQNETVVEN